MFKVIILDRRKVEYICSYMAFTDISAGLVDLYSPVESAVLPGNII